MLILWKPSGGVEICFVCRDYQPVFSPPPETNMEFLNCGVLTISGATLGDYLIEWKKGSVSGDTVFTTGNLENRDVAKESSHPLVNEIVEAGDIYPVIKYIEVNSLKYSPYNTGEYIYSPDLLNCIQPPFITIESIKCGETNYSGDYDYRLIRNVGVGEDSRRFNWELSPTANYFAWGFDTVNVADGIKISYCTEADPVGEVMDYLVFGINIPEDLSPANYPRQAAYNPSLPIDPIVISVSYYRSTTGVLKYVSDLTPYTFQTGDYLKIEILGNIYEQKQDTKWTLYGKCFDGFDTYNMKPVSTKTSTSTMEWIDSSCAYRLKYTTADRINASGFQNSFINKYFYMMVNPGNGQYTSIGGSGYLQWRTILSSAGESNFGCSLLSGTVTATKQATSILYTYTNIADYNKTVSDIAHVEDNPYYNYYLSATDQYPEYYGIYRLHGYQSGIGCDSAGSRYGWYLPIRGTVVTYDNINKTIKFEFPSTPFTNEMTGNTEPCNYVNSTIDAYVSYANNTMNSVPIGTTYTSSIRNNYSIGSIISRTNNRHETNRNFYYQTYIPKILFNNLFNAEADGYVPDGNYYRAFQIKDRIQLTDTTDHTSRLCSWKLYRDKFLRTKLLADYGTEELIEEGSCAI